MAIQSFGELRTQFDLPADTSAKGYESLYQGLAGKQAPLVAPAPEQSFLQKRESYLAGERPLMEYNQLKGKGFLGGTAAVISNIGKGVVNLAGNLARTTGQITERGIQSAIGMPGMLQDQKVYQEAQRHMAKTDENLSKRIKFLNTLKTPESKLLLKKIREQFVVRSNQGDIPEPILTKAMDVTNEQATLESVDAFVTALVLKSPGIFAAAPFKGAREALIGTSAMGPLVPLGIKAGKDALLKSAIGYGLENAALNAIATGALPGEKKFSDYMEAAGFGFAFGALGGTAVGVGAPRLMMGMKMRSKLADNASAELSATAAKAEREIGELTGYERRVYRNMRNTKVKKASPDVMTTTPVKDFSTALHGDVVRLPSGVTGVITGIRDVAVSNVKEYNALRRDINAYHQSGDASEATVEALRASQKRLDDITLEATLAGKLSELAGPERIKLIEMRVRLGKGLVTTLVDESKLKGGTVLSRQRFEFTGIEALRKSDPALAAKLEATGNSVQKARQARGNYTTYTDSKSGHTYVLADESAAITSDDVRKAMSAQGYSVMDEAFPQPGRQTVLSVIPRSTRNLRASGGTDTPLIRAAKAQEMEQAAYVDRMSGVTNAVLDEAGVPYAKAQTPIGQTLESVSLAVRFATNAPMRQRLAAKSERLFRAAEGEIPLADLTKAERAWVNQWKSVSAELWQDVNKVSIAIGKGPIKGISEGRYLTNLIAQQARIMLELTGSPSSALPNEINSILSRQGQTLARKAAPKQVIDTLLKKRYGGLPIERDAFAAAQSAISAHTRFIHLQPALAESRIALKYFTQRFPQLRKNAELWTNYLRRISGYDDPNRVLRDLDYRAMELLMAEKIFGVWKNPLRALTTELMDTEAFGKVLVPSKGLLSLADKVGFTEGIIGPGFIKSLGYAANLALSTTFNTLNLTQFWLLAVPKLRGKLTTRYADAVKGQFSAISTVFSPKAWEHYRKLGILNEIENLVQFEIEGATSKLGKRSSVIGKSLSTFTAMTEYINRVSAYEAGRLNVHSSPKAYMNEIEKLGGKSLEKAANKVGEMLTDIANFKFGVVHSAPISDNPFFALGDQYNSYARNWWAVIKGQLDRAGKDPQIMEAIRTAHKDPAKFAKLIGDDFMNAGQRGEIFRYLLNTTAFFTVMTGAGMGYGKAFWDFYGGGGTRLLTGVSDLGEGLADGDKDKVDKAIGRILIPPSVPPYFDAVRDAWGMTTPEGRTEWIPKTVLASYSPFRKLGLETIPAVKSLFTGEPVPIFDPKTGEVRSIVHPDEAVAKILFGSRSKTEAQRQKDLDEISRLNNLATAKNNAMKLTARKFLEDIHSAPPEKKKFVFDTFVEEGKMDREMLNTIVRMEVGGRFDSDSVERSLAGLPNEQKAQFLLPKLRVLEPEARVEYLSNLWTKSAISKDTFLELNKLLASEK